MSTISQSDDIYKEAIRNLNLNHKKPKKKFKTFAARHATINLILGKISIAMYIIATNFGPKIEKYSQKDHPSAKD